MTQRWNRPPIGPRTWGTAPATPPGARGLPGWGRDDGPGPRARGPRRRPPPAPPTAATASPLRRRCAALRSWPADLLGLVQQGLEVAILDPADDVVEHEPVGIDEERLGHAPHA